MPATKTETPWLALSDTTAPRRWFISYPSAEVALASMLEASLAKLGHAVWRDQSRLASGERWLDAILKALDDADGVIAILTRPAQLSKVVPQELDEAQKRGLPIHAFTDFDLREAVALYAPVATYHYVRLPEETRDTARCARVLAALTDHGLDPEHPDPLDYLRRAASIITPSPDALAADAGLAARLIASLGGRAALRSPWQALNIALLEAERGNWDAARELVAGRRYSDARGAFHAATVLLASREPRTLESCAEGDEIDGLLALAFGLRKSPLIALFLAWFRLAGNRGSGTGYRKLLQQALEAITPVDLPEFRRWRRLTHAPFPD